jgi:hypothetical protein
VSVRSSREARLALAGGADLVDVKDPARGALGAAEPAVWAEIVSTEAGRVPMSVALGEVSETEEPTYPQVLAEFQFAKLGLAGCRCWADWPRRWQERLQLLPSQVAPVAVVYADWPVAQAPRPETVLERAAEMGCGVVLFDTFCKTNGDLLHHLGQKELARLTHWARGWGMRVVFGGSLGPATIQQVLTLAPDYIAIRGAACRGARTDAVDAGLVRGLRRLIRGDQPRSLVPRGDACATIDDEGARSLP